MLHCCTDDLSSADRRDMHDQIDQADGPVTVISPDEANEAHEAQRLFDTKPRAGKGGRARLFRPARLVSWHLVCCDE